MKAARMAWPEVEPESRWPPPSRIVIPPLAIVLGSRLVQNRSRDATRIALSRRRSCRGGANTLAMDGSRSAEVKPGDASNEVRVVSWMMLLLLRGEVQEMSPAVAWRLRVVGCYQPRSQ